MVPNPRTTSAPTVMVRLDFAFPADEQIDDPRARCSRVAGEVLATVPLVYYELVHREGLRSSYFVERHLFDATKPEVVEADARYPEGTQSFEVLLFVSSALEPPDADLATSLSDRLTERRGSGLANAEAAPLTEALAALRVIAHEETLPVPHPRGRVELRRRLPGGGGLVPIGLDEARELAARPSDPTELPTPPEFVTHGPKGS